MVMGPSTRHGDCTESTTAARAEGSNGGTGLAAATESEQPVWDEDDVMLFFWGNSMAATERRAKKEQECKECIDEWRAGTAV
jgi:hypothetical protein